MSSRIALPRIVLTLLLMAAASSASALAGPIQAVTSKIAPKAPANPASMVRDKWAVVIGIGRFQDPSIQPERLAAGSVNEMVKALRDPDGGRFGADHVLSLAGNRATKTGILDALTGSWLVKKALPHDLVFLYFSTSTVPSPDGKDLYLCAYDTLASEADLSGISLKELLSDLRHRTQCRYIVCALDTTPEPGSTAGGVTPASIAQSTGVSLLTTDKLERPSPPCAVEGSSCFAHYLAETMREAMGLTPLQMVSERIAQHLKEEAAKTGGKTPEPILVLAADARELASIPLGLPVKSSRGPKRYAIGHPVDDLPLSRPDLARPRQMAAQSKADREEEQEENEQEAVNGVNFGTYMSKMKQDIQKRWQPPRGFENRQVVAVFTIRRDGTIVDPQIVESSGVDAVDNSAVQALKAASPLDALPLGAPRSVQIRYQFDWRVSHN